MDIYDRIDEFFEILRDPRNISPELVGDYYPLNQVSSNAIHFDFIPKFTTRQDVVRYYNLNFRFKQSHTKGYVNNIEAKKNLIVNSFNKGNIDNEDKAQCWFYLRDLPMTREPNFEICYLSRDGLMNDKHILVILKMYDAFYKNYVQSLMLPIAKSLNELGDKKKVIQQSTKKKPKLTINQIALKYVYSNKQITRENGDEIIEQYGYKSGEKLFQRYTYYSSQTNRKGKPQPCTLIKLKNKIQLLESIVPLVPADNQSRIKDEVYILKSIMDAEYL